MNKLQISSGLALVIGIVMAIWGAKLSRQKNLADQTEGEFILATALTVGGVLIALIAAFAAGRSSSK